MSWRNVKTLLLVLLVAANLFLFSVVRTYYKDRAYTDTQTAEEAVSLLAKSDLLVRGDLLAVRSDTAAQYACAYDRENYLCLTAMLFFGREADGIYLLPDGIRAECRDGSVAVLGNDLSLFYLHGGTDESTVREALAAAHPAMPEADGVRERLQSLLLLTDAQLSALDYTVYRDFLFVTVTETLDGLPLYGMTCTFGFSGETLVFAEGKYFFDRPAKEEDAPLLSRIHILFSEKERGRTGEVTDFSLCLVPYEDTESGRLLFLPAYTVSFSDGTNCTVNALDGTPYA